MKKTTLLTKLSTLEAKVRKVENVEQREKQLAAIQVCRQWVGLSWGDMLKPVSEKMKEIEQQATPYLQKRKQKQQLDMQEAAAYALLSASYDIYHHFRTLIYSTVRQAQMTRDREAQYREMRHRQ